MFMDWLKKAPTAVTVSVIIVAGVGVLALIGGFVFLTYSGKPTDEYRTFVNTLANLLMLPLGGLAAVASVSAARSASKTEEQTNGQLTEKDREIADLKRELLYLSSNQTPRRPQ